jgi:hypothetical protein
LPLAGQINNKPFSKVLLLFHVLKDFFFGRNENNKMNEKNEKNERNENNERHYPN